MNNSITNYKRKNSWGPLMELRNEMDRLFDDFWGMPVSAQASDRTWQPACDVVEDDDHYLLSVEMAGIPKEQIKIEVQDQHLVISGERRAEEVKKEKGFKYSERQHGAFLRSFALPSGFDAEKIEANYQDGVLRVLVPKPNKLKPRQIKIGTGSNASFFGKLIGQSSTREKEERHSSSANQNLAS